MLTMFAMPTLLTIFTVLLTFYCVHYPFLSHGGDRSETLHTNVRPSPRLRAALDRIESLGNQEPHTFATDVTAAPALLAALDEAKAAFREISLSEIRRAGVGGAGVIRGRGKGASASASTSATNSKPLSDDGEKDGVGKLAAVQKQGKEELRMEVPEVAGTPTSEELMAESEFFRKWPLT